MSHTRSLFFIGLLLSQCAGMSVRAQETNRASFEKPGATASDSAKASDPLLKLLVSKGVVTNAEAESILSAGDVTAQRDRLAALLKEKGLISAGDVAWL